MSSLDQETQKELRSIINTSTTELFSTMFRTDIDSSGGKDLVFYDDFISSATLSQDNLDVIFRVVIPRPTLTSLLMNIYDPAIATHEKILEDAILEISSIISSQLCDALNSWGNHLETTLPTIAHDFRPEKWAENCLNINFTVSESVFAVGVKVIDK